jgi:cytochrome c2
LNKKHALFFVVISLVLYACAGQASASSLGNPEDGKILFNQTRIGEAPACGTCHSVEADKVIVGPSLAGVGTRAAERIPGKSATEYLRESIINPNSYIVNGFSAGVMYQRFKDTLTDEQIYNLIAYLLTLH